MEFELKDGDYAWTAQARFDSWAGYRDCSGPYGSEGSDEASDGSVEIVFAPEGRDDEPLTPDEHALVKWLVDHEPAVSEEVKASVYVEYLWLRQNEDYSELANYMPAISSPDELKPLVGLQSVNVHQVSKNGLPYVGFELGCSWDPEHGVGVLMHGTRLVRVGGADTAILLWMAEEDAEKP